MTPLTTVRELRIVAGFELCCGALMFAIRLDFARKHGWVATEFAYLSVWLGWIAQAIFGRRGFFELSRYSGAELLSNTAATVAASRRTSWLLLVPSVCVAAAEIAALITEPDGVVFNACAALVFAALSVFTARNLLKLRNRAAIDVLSPIS